MEKARHAAVIIEETGRKHSVIMHYEEYGRLQALEDQLWGMAAAEAEKSGYIGTEKAMKLLTRLAE